MKRRAFLRDTITSIALPSLLGNFPLRVLGASPFLEGLAGKEAANDRVLVLIQLNGGNDGLNTVIPLDSYAAYFDARSNIAIPENKALRLEGFDGLGFNPAMAGMSHLFNEGKMMIVQGVSYPRPNYSHFRSMDIWLTGSDSQEVLFTGWAGRYLDEQYPGFPESYPNMAMPDPPAIQIGSIVSPALQGHSLSMGMAINDPTSFYDLVDGQLPSPTASRAGAQLNYVREMALQTDQYAVVIKKAAQKVTSQSDRYPSAGKNALADQLKIVARLVGGGLKTKIYMVSMGSFDTHARQTEATDPTTGVHAKLLAQLSEAVEAFMADLQQLNIADRVLGMTFSEFGRRVKSNASGGTDHGAAAPVFLFGTQVQHGVLGHTPDFPSLMKVGNVVPMQYDFRSLYASVLEKWFGIAPQTAEKVLLKDYQSLPLVREAGSPATYSTQRNTPPGLLLQNYPNPFVSDTAIHFSSFGGHTMVQVFDKEGQLVAVAADGIYTAGTHVVSLKAEALPVGSYYVRLQNGLHQQVRVLEKCRG